MNDKIKLLEDEINQAAKSYRLMQHHHLVEHILHRHGLEHYLSYFNAFNSSNSIPYHNKYHTFCMVLNVYEASRYYGLYDEQTRSLLVAALFHDIDHSGGVETDDVNVQVAIETLARAHDKICLIAQNKPMCGDNYARLTSQELIDAVITLKITKYPYDGPPITLLQKIIRDADLMQLYEENQQRLRDQFLGLKSEMEIKHGPFTSEQWADGCRDFNQKTVWHTMWASDKAVALDHKACTEHLRNLLIGQE